MVFPDFVTKKTPIGPNSTGVFKKEKIRNQSAAKLLHPAAAWELQSMCAVTPTARGFPACLAGHFVWAVTLSLIKRYPEVDRHCPALCGTSKNLGGGYRPKPDNLSIL